MTYRDIYKRALSLIGGTLDADTEGEYEARAPYIFGSLIDELSELDTALRRAKGEDPVLYGDRPYRALDEVFPLCRRLNTPAAHYMASLLLSDSLSETERSDELYDRFCLAVSRLTDSLPAELKATAEVY